MSKLLSVKELQMKIAEAESAKASAALKAQQAEEAERRPCTTTCSRRPD
jgi:hypothetical protein